MKTEFTNRFFKDIDKITQAAVKNDISAVIQEIEKANHLSEVKNTKKLKDHSIAYRIRIGDYRIGLYYENNTVEFIRVVHRKDIYKVFP